MRTMTISKPEQAHKQISVSHPHKLPRKPTRA